MSRRPNDPQRRERILQATLETIAEHGISAVTHRKIASCAGVPLGSMTYYFEGMDSLIEEAFTRFTRDMAQQYRDCRGDRAGNGLRIDHHPHLQFRSDDAA